MFSSKILPKSLALSPYQATVRWRVRNLPKEHYDKYETPYMKVEKPGKSALTDFLAFAHSKNLKLSLLNWMKKRNFEARCNDQRYLPERHKTLGPDLATAHFITVRGGKIKFRGSTRWMNKENINSGEIPSSYVRGLYIEELDASGMGLCFEGFENLSSLQYLKKLILSNCTYVDDWCLSRSYLFETSLEYLDISGCHNVSERGICTLHVLKQLKTLVLNDTPNIQNKELVSLLLQELIPKCEIVGVNYDDPILLQRVHSFLT